MNVETVYSNIFATIKNKTVIHGSTNQKDIRSCHPGLSGLKSTNCGNSLEIFTLIKRIIIPIITKSHVPFLLKQFIKFVSKTDINKPVKRKLKGTAAERS